MQQVLKYARGNPYRTAAVGLGAVGLAALLVFGCRQEVARIPDAPKEAAEGADPWPAASAQLRKENDAGAVRRVLSELNNRLATADQELQPAALDPAREQALRADLRLTDDEAREVRPAAYSALDGQHVAEALYLRDAARALDVGGLPPARQAELAFAWVCRQVVLQPWVLPILDPAGRPAFDPSGKPVGQPLMVPPAYVLRRGSGSGLERAVVFVGLLRQLGFDGCLVGPPGADAEPPPVAPQPVDALSRGPFWAVGAKVGADVLLFDPWAGGPVPGPSGPATLAAAKANPDALGAWLSANRPAPLAPDAVRSATPYVVLPLTAAAPRMARLERALKTDFGVTLAVDPTTAKGRFGPDARVWGPPADGRNPYARLAPTRAAAAFLPVEEGGVDPLPKLYGLYVVGLVPRAVFAGIPDPVRGVPGASERLQVMAADAFAGTFLAPPVPRERVQRGRFAEATATLVERRKAFFAGHERARQNQGFPEAVRGWADRARDVYDLLDAARDKAKTDPGGVAAAEAAVDRFWKEEAGTVGAVIDLAVSDAGMAEATYLIALSLSEQAERAQARYERAATDPARRQAADAWAEARGAWAEYLQQHAAAQDRAFPGRADHARRLADRADRQASDLAAAGAGA